jgi:uncharacterized protein (DUF488 family)
VYRPLTEAAYGIMVRPVGPKSIMSEQISIFTIGHSTHPLDDFLALLVRHRIRKVVDIRRFPSSRKFPHFNQQQLAPALKSAGLDYRWMEALGGRRHKQRTGSPSPNFGLHNASFRNYADYMLTEAFRAAVQELLKHARRNPIAVMCAEALFWRCHRRLVSDFLVAQGAAVQHVFPSGEVRAHRLTGGAVIVGETVIYPPSIMDKLEPENAECQGHDR